jgi:hypothetical protein
LWNYRLIAVVTVPYIMVNVRNHPKPVVTVIDNLTGSDGIGLDWSGFELKSTPSSL